jgi:hypothetical protein
VAAHSCPWPWGWATWPLTQGIPFEREAVVHSDTERFCQLGLTNDRFRATFRSDLRGVGPLLTPGRHGRGP